MSIGVKQAEAEAGYNSGHTMSLSPLAPMSAATTNHALRSPLGAQIWLEPEDSAERVNQLCARAAESGLGWLRIFLMWPWIERTPEQWDFAVFDRVFASAERHGLKIKATLTANSGPAWLGTPGMLHSFTGLLDPAQRGVVERYIAKCVARYAASPALGQWILWNEPAGGGDRTPETAGRWREFLRGRYAGDLGRLNRRWLTAYATFEEIPFAEAVPHPLHRGSHWAPYRAALDDAAFRAEWLNHQLAWIAERVRALDPRTELCINPTQVIANQAAGGTDLAGMGRICEVIGASYHPAWQFAPFAQRADYPGLMSAGVRHCASHPEVRRVEVTEVQMGNTFQSSHRPNTVHPGELVRFFLAGLAAGAETITGWCFNIRTHDNEAGDWALLDDNDQIGARARALRQLRDAWSAAQAKAGRWSAAPTDVWLPMDPRAQALEMVEAPANTPLPGRRLQDSAYGVALLAQRCGELGLTATPVRVANLPAAPERGPGEVAFVSHLVAWEEPEALRLLAWAEAGGTLVLDATCGRKDFNATQSQPWPGFLGECIGLVATGHESRAEHYALTLGGAPAGVWLATRLCARLAPDAGWSAWSDLRFAVDGEAAVWERAWGRGRIVVARGLVGPSLIDNPDNLATRVLIARAAAGRLPALRPVSGQRGLTSIPIACEHGTLVAVLAPELTEGGVRPVRLHGQSGREWGDFWSGETYVADATGEIALSAPDGVALLWNPHR